MTPFFPENPFTGPRVDSLLKRIPRSLIPMAIITGIAVHSYIWLVLARSSANFGLIALLLAFAGRFVLLLVLATIYLGNHPVRQWLWRAPLFALAEWAVEAVHGRGADPGTGGAHRHGARAGAPIGHPSSPTR